MTIQTYRVFFTVCEPPSLTDDCLIIDQLID